MRDWLFRLLWPKQRAVMFDAARRFAETELRREYRRKLFSATRQTPLDESVWIRKFTELDADYAELVKEVQDLRVENMSLKRQLYT